MRVPSYLIALILTSVACAAPSTEPTTQNDAAPSPNPAYTPQEVVHIQLDALGRNDDPTPDAGIAVAFRFASPENQKQTGPVEKFARMLKNPQYRPMLDHRSADYGQTHLDGAEAQILVKVTAGDGEVALYLFMLGKQADGPYHDCWMTQGVMRLRPQDIAPAPPADQPANNGDGHDKT